MTMMLSVLDDPSLRPPCPSWCTGEHVDDFEHEYGPGTWIYLHSAAVGEVGGVVVDICQAVQIRADGSIVETSPTSIGLQDEDGTELASLSLGAAGELGRLLGGLESA